jgi:hypothetical protein
MPMLVAQLIDKGDLADDSWHNDACPSVCVPQARELTPTAERDGYYPKLWIDAMDPDHRECGGPRFGVMGSDGDPEGHETMIIHTDDLATAIAHLNKATAEYLARWATIPT